MPVTFSSYRLGPGQRVSNKTVPPPWDWLLRRENELGPRRSKSQIIFAVLVPPLYVAVQAPALIVTIRHHICDPILKTDITTSWLRPQRYECWSMSFFDKFIVDKDTPVLKSCLSGDPGRAKARCPLLKAVTDWNRSASTP